MTQNLGEPKFSKSVMNENNRDLKPPRSEGRGFPVRKIDIFV
jgi:hypothetical protein